MEKIEPPFIMTVTGPKRSGKTTFIRNLLNKHLLKKFEYVIVMSPTLELSGDFEFLREQNRTKYMFCADGFNDTVASLFARQETLKRLDKAPQVLLVVDDCATDPILSANSILDKFTIRHRHSNLSMIVVGHQLRGVCGLPKATRSQIDYSVFFNPASITELETIIRDAVGREFKDYMTAIHDLFSTKYNFLVFEPAAPWRERLLANWKTPIADQIVTKDKPKRRRKSDFTNEDTKNDTSDLQL